MLQQVAPHLCPRRLIAPVLAGSLLLFLPLLQRPATAATVRTVDGKTFSGTLTDAKNGELLIQTQPGAAGLQHLPLSNLISLTLTWQERIAAASDPKPAPAPAATHPATQPKPLPTWHAELANGDHFTASLVAWGDTTLTLRAPTLSDGLFSLPVERVRALWSMSDALVKKARDISLSAPGMDVAYVAAEGDVKAVAGVVTGLDGEFLTFKFEGQERKIKLERLVGLSLAQRETTPDTRLYESCILSTGELISGTVVGLHGKALAIDPLWAQPDAAGKIPPLDLPLANLEKLAVHNGRLVWLGDMKPAIVEQAAYFDRVIPYRVNHSLAGANLNLTDGVVENGVATHAKCHLTYDLAGAYDRFRAKVGFQQPEGKLGRAAVSVVADGKILWQNADFKGPSRPALLDLDVAGVKTLQLNVDFGKEQDVGDEIVWGDAKLIKAK